MDVNSRVRVAVSALLVLGLVCNWTSCEALQFSKDSIPGQIWKDCSMLFQYYSLSVICLIALAKLASYRSVLFLQEVSHHIVSEI